MKDNTGEPHATRVVDYMATSHLSGLNIHPPTRGHAKR